MALRPLNELKYDAFKASTGLGRLSYNDLEKAFYIQSTGIPKAIERDYWRQFNPTLNLEVDDLKRTYLVGLYGNGSNNDLEQRYWSSAGAPTATQAVQLLTAVNGSPATFIDGIYAGTGNTVVRTWRIDGVTVQTGGIYILQPADVGKTLTVRNTVTNAFGQLIDTSNGVVVT